MDELLIRRVNNWLAGEKEPPYKVDLFLTNKCNLRCQFCEFPTQVHNEPELTKDQIIKLARDSGKLKTQIFSILGGEPFFRQDVIIDLLTEIKKQNMRGSLVTNGSLITKEMAETIKEIKWDFMRISIDGDEETHDKLRGIKGTYKRVISTLDYFKYSDYPTIEINTVLNKENYNLVSHIIRLASKYNIKFVYLLPMIEFNERSHNLKINEKEFPIVKESLLKAKELAKEVGVNHNIDSVIADNLCINSNETQKTIYSEKKQENFIPCFLPWYGISITAQGYATPCSQFNIINTESIKTKSLEEIWYGKLFNKIRENMKKNILGKNCSRCCVPLLDENKKIRELLK